MKFNKNNKKFLIENNIKYLDLKNYIPNFIKSKNENQGKVLIESINSDKIKLKYIAKSRHKNLVQEYKTIIPRKLPLNQDILSMIGLLEAEMNKSRIDSNITFSNSEPDLIKCVIHYFEKYFDIYSNQWKWLIQFNKKLTYSEDYLETKSRELASLDFWKKETPISNRIIRKWSIYRGLDEGLIRTKNKWGMLHIFYSNVFLKNILLNIIEDSFLINSLSKKQISSYLEGLFCGDGGSNLSGNVRMIFLTSHNKNKREKLNRLIRQLGINSHLYKGTMVRTNDLNSIFSFYKLNLFKLHPEKRMKFLDVLVSYKQFQGRSKYVKKDFESYKELIDNERKKLLNLIQKRKIIFGNIQNKYKKSVKKNLNYEIEIKLEGLARKSTRYKVADVICQNQGILISNVVKETGLNYSSVYHAISRLYKEELISKKFKKNSNKIKLFPSDKLLKELEKAKKLIDKFNKRYEVHKNG